MHGINNKVLVLVDYPSQWGLDERLLPLLVSSISSNSDRKCYSVWYGIMGCGPTKETRWVGENILLRSNIIVDLSMMLSMVGQICLMRFYTLPEVAARVEFVLEPVSPRLRRPYQGEFVA